MCVSSGLYMYVATNSLGSLVIVQVGTSETWTDDETYIQANQCLWLLRPLQSHHCSKPVSESYSRTLFDLREEGIWPHSRRSLGMKKRHVKKLGQPLSDLSSVYVRSVPPRPLARYFGHFLDSCGPCQSKSKRVAPLICWDLRGYGMC